MADRVTPPPTGIPRVRTVAEQRWRERAEAADDRRDSSKRKPRRNKQQRPNRGGGIDEFA